MDDYRDFYAADGPTVWSTDWKEIDSRKELEGGETHRAKVGEDESGKEAPDEPWPSRYNPRQRVVRLE